MNTFIYVERNEQPPLTFGEIPPDSNMHTLVGYAIDNHRRDIPISLVFQVGGGVRYTWCASIWSHPPADELWGALGEDTVLFTGVERVNLNFHNTPLEHRHNLYAQKCWHRSSELVVLAQNEIETWGDGKAFIPFKTPQPSGYQGVWLFYDTSESEIRETLVVMDRFLTSHRLMGHITH